MMLPALMLMAPPAGGAGGGGSPFAFPLMMGALVLIMYFLIIRPQQTAAKKQQAMINAVKKGDRVLTTGGIYGRVVGVHDKENMVVLQIADKVNVEIQKNAIAGVANPTGVEARE